MLFRCYSYGIYESKWHVRRLRRNCINIRYLIAVLCRMFPFSLREGNDIVHQSHKVGACPPPRLKHFYRDSLFLFIAFAGSILHLQERSFELFFDSFRYYNCTGPSPRSGPKIWSSPQHILREDELEDYSWFSPLPWCLSQRSGPKTW